MNFNKDFDTNVGEILLDFLQFCKFCVENENSEGGGGSFFCHAILQEETQKCSSTSIEVKTLMLFLFFVQVNHFQKVSFVYHFIRELQHKL